MPSVLKLPLEISVAVYWSGTLRSCRPSGRSYRFSSFVEQRVGCYCRFGRSLAADLPYPNLSEVIDFQYICDVLICLRLLWIALRDEYFRMFRGTQFQMWPQVLV